jgi:Zn-dependent protease with chaperone function
MRRILFGLAAGALFGAAVVGLLNARTAEAQETQPAPAAAAREEPAIRVTPEMLRYSNTRYALYFAAAFVNVLALVVLLRSGVSARLRDLAERRGRNGLLRAYVYYPLFTLAYGALTLPLVFYSRYLLPHQYGLSNQSFGGWVLDGMKAFALSALLGPLVVALLYWTLRRSPRRWWFGFWLASIPLLVMTILLAPLVVDPLFNRFGPLRNEPLRERILALAREAGIEHGRVFEVDASQRTKQVNAYVTGVGGSARIVLWDTLLQRLDEDEVAFVMAHEMGHYVEGHVPMALAGSIAGSFFFLWLTDRLARSLLERNGEAWKVRGPDDLASFPALLLIVTLLNFFGSPVESAVSRHFERRADEFGLRIAPDGRAAASAFVKLGELNLSNPDPPPFVEFWMFSHPPLKERIGRALAAGPGDEAASSRPLPPSGGAPPVPPEAGPAPR